MAQNSARGLLTSVDSLFTTQAEREEAKLTRVEEIPIELIDDFPNHPYKVRMDDSMARLIESVSEHGVLEPALVRPKPDGRYEMVAGHRRKEASIQAQIPVMRCIVQDMTDDQAVIIMVRLWLSLKPRSWNLRGTRLCAVRPICSSACIWKPRSILPRPSR